MSRINPRCPPQVVEAAMAAFDEQSAKLPGLRVALLSTPDGFEIASRQAQGEQNSERLAAMTSSLMAMARAVGREVNYSGCNRLIFEAEHGVVIVQAVPATFPSLLCLVLDPDTVLGTALWSASAIVSTMCKVF